MSGLVLAADGAIPGGIATVISALRAAFIGVASLAFNSAKATRDRRRDLYSQADKVSMSWITGTAPLRRLTIGHTLPHEARPAAVYLDGRRQRAQVRQTDRGSEVTVRTRPGRHVLTVVAG